MDIEIIENCINRAERYFIALTSVIEWNKIKYKILTQFKNNKKPNALWNKTILNCLGLIINKNEKRNIIDKKI